MNLTLKCLLYLIFAVSLFTGINELIGGTAAIPGAATTVLPAIDNELRCIAVFWLAFGAFCFWVANNIHARQQFIQCIALVMLLSAAARLVSIALVGMPGHALFTAMIVEFVISIAIYISYRKVFRKSLSHCSEKTT